MTARQPEGIDVIALWEAAPALEETPLGAILHGAAAGLTAAVLLSVLSRILPGMRQPTAGPLADRHSPLPRKLADHQPVGVRLRRALSPAMPAPHEKDQTGRSGEPPAATAPNALVQPLSPGPEGLAEQFAFKVAAGLFGRDVSPHLRPTGLAVHLVYGSAWGALYGVLQATYRQPPLLFGTVYGLIVWLVGPVLLVPAMKLLLPPSREPALRTAMLFAGHLVYGIATALLYEVFVSG